MSTRSQAQTQTPKRKIGRPPKEKGGQNLWIPADIVDTVKLMIQVSKQQQQQQKASQ